MHISEMEDTVDQTAGLNAFIMKKKKKPSPVKAQDVKPDVSPEIAPEISPVDVPVATPEITPEIEPEVIPAIEPEPVPDAASPEKPADPFDVDDQASADAGVLTNVQGIAPTPIPTIGETDPEASIPPIKDAETSERPADPFEVEAESPQIATSELPADPFGDPADNAAQISAIGAAHRQAVEGPHAGGPILESEAERKFRFASLVANPMANIIQRGDITDDKPGVEEQPVESHKDRLVRIGIPPRPRIWPVMMAWPPARDIKMLDNPEITQEQRNEYTKGLLASRDKMMARAREIDAYIREHHKTNPNSTGKRLINNIRDIRNKNGWEHFDRATQADPFYGVRFATLLDPTQTATVSKLVSNWGHEVARTADGGEVRVTDNTISIGVVDKRTYAVTDMSIQLAIREGIARGWESFKVSGSYEFARNFEKHALAAGIKAEITYGADPFGWPKRTKIIMPPPPGAPAAAKAEAEDRIADICAETGKPLPMSAADPFDDKSRSTGGPEQGASKQKSQSAKPSNPARPSAKPVEPMNEGDAKMPIADNPEVSAFDV